MSSAGAFLCTKSAWFVGGGIVFFAGCGQKKRAGLLQAPLNARKEKKPCGLKSKNLEANNRFLNQEGLEFDTF
ncbi:hypothetical protein [Aeromonas enteropelogenes]|uniref:hypothetical protein n=1 Tax=Aeromonas enteropelogenes TaxID=29489 RepID=UPI003BA379E0